MTGLPVISTSSLSQGDLRLLIHNTPVSWESCSAKIGKAGKTLMDAAGINMISDKWFELLEMVACMWNEYSAFILRGIM